MISYCVFESGYHNKGVATEAMRLFLDAIVDKYHFKTIGAFAYSSNISSIRVLEKNNFKMVEEFVENGIPSKYFELEIER